MLDLEKHRYFYGGERVAGVSEILSGLGIVDRSHFTDFGRERGVAVHAALEFHLTWGLDWDSVDPRIRGFIDGALKYLSVAGVKGGPDTIVERSVYNSLFRYAGTLDLFAIQFGEEAVTDWKSGGLGAAGIATAGYELAARQVFKKEKPLRRIAVQLHPNGTYTMKDLRDGFDYIHFQYAVSLFNKFHLPRLKGVSRVAAA